MNITIDQVLLVYALLFNKAAGDGLGLPEIELWELVNMRIEMELLAG